MSPFGAAFFRKSAAAHPNTRVRIVSALGGVAASAVPPRCSRVRPVVVANWVSLRATSTTEKGIVPRGRRYRRSLRIQGLPWLLCATATATGV